MKTKMEVVCVLLISAAASLKANLISSSKGHWEEQIELLIEEEQKDLHDLEATLPTNAGSSPEKAIADARTPEQFYSQFGEDKSLFEKYFTDTTQGKYIEIGGLDGVRYSNTKAFQDSHGWTGLLIEPQPACHDQLRKNRPQDIIVPKAVCSTKGTLQLGIRERFCLAAGGGMEVMSDAHKKQFAITQSTQVDCEPMSDMVRTSGLTTVDLLSVDVEGAEQQVLKTFDFSKIPVHVVMVEMTPHSHKDASNLDEIRTLMAAAGFHSDGIIGKKTVPSEVFINPNYPSLPKRVA